MYPSLTESVGGSSSSSSGPILIPKRFVWPYGGTRVYLIGSFTRWSEHIPMSPMEGCPSVFQVICSLMPGYHQFKFNVDGQWRYDEQQPFVNGNYGVVNTIYLVREPDILPAILSAETSSRSHMEVDNDVFGHAVCCGTSNDAWFAVLPRGWTDCSFQHNMIGLVSQVPHWLCGTN